MRVRKPQLDYAGCEAHWSPDAPEFSQINNAASTVLPHLEPYLIKVLRRVREQLDAAQDARLLHQVDIFIRQEANHYKQHQQFNEQLYRAGYSSLKHHEEQLQSDYRDFLENRSLKFNLAYSEGFESLGIIQAEFIFERAGRWLEGADESVTILWQWHLAEEFEHRRVCYDAYERLYGGYFYRIYGLLFAIRHLGGYGKRVSKHLLQLDRQRGKVGSPWLSRWREQHYRWALGLFTLPRILRILSPFYNPARIDMPGSATALLESAAVEFQQLPQ